MPVSVACACAGIIIGSLFASGLGAFDLLIVEKIGDTGSFETKLEKLCSTGMIDSAEKDMLLAVIDAGNASAHRSYRPKNKAMNHIMDILEEIFYKMVVTPSRKQDLAAKAKALREITPKRDTA